MLERGRVRAPKAVQGLIEIADEHHVLVILSQGEGDGVLRPVHVLALVHDDVREAACQQTSRVLLLCQERARVQHEVIELLEPFLGFGLLECPPAARKIHVLAAAVVLVGIGGYAHVFLVRHSG